MRVNQILAIAAIAATVAMATACGGQQQPTVTTESVPDEVVQRFLAAMDEFDPTAVRELFSPNAKLMPPNVGAIEGPDAIVEFYKGALADELDFEFRQAAAGMAGGLAVSEGTYRVLIKASGEEIEAGKWMAVWINRDGTWKIARLMTNTDHSVAAPVIDVEEGLSAEE